MIKAAIVGLGAWGRRLVEAVQDADGPHGGVLAFTHAAARRPERIQAFCDRYRLQIQSFEAVVADPGVDAVVLATPHSQHAAQAMEAARRGKHVFVEKPLALTASDAQAVVASCAEAGVVLAVGQNRRFLPAFCRLKDLLQAGEIGTLLHGEAVFAGAFGLGYQPGMWRASPVDSPAGGLTAMGIHSLDALIALVGPIDWVCGQSMRRILTIPMDDTTTASLRFAGGPTGHVATLMATAWTWQLRLFGSKGYAEMPDEGTLRLTSRLGGSRTDVFAPSLPERRELEAFGRAIRGEAPYPVPLDEVVHGIAVLEAILASIETGSEPRTVQR